MFQSLVLVNNDGLGVEQEICGMLDSRYSIKPSPFSCAKQLRLVTSFSIMALLMGVVCAQFVVRHTSASSGVVSVNTANVSANSASASTAPQIERVVGSDGALSVRWTLPDTIDLASVKGHDLRFVRSDTADKSDANWTVRGLSSKRQLGGLLLGLENDVQYDVQVRVDDGQKRDWSTTAVGTPSLPGDSCKTADTLHHNHQYVGQIRNLLQKDYFKFTLDATSDVFISSHIRLMSDTENLVPPPDTGIRLISLKLFQEESTNVAPDDPCPALQWVSDNIDNIVELESSFQLASGNYLVELFGISDHPESDFYELRFQVRSDSSTLDDASEIEVGNVVGGTFGDIAANGRAEDIDVFKFVLPVKAPVSVNVRTGWPATKFDVELLDSEGNRIFQNKKLNSFSYLRNLDPTFDVGVVRPRVVGTLAAGTYYVKLTGVIELSCASTSTCADDIIGISGVGYRVLVDVVEDFGVSFADPWVVELERLGNQNPKFGYGVVSADVSENYFGFEVVSDDAFIVFDLLSTEVVKPELVVELFDSDEERVDGFVLAVSRGESSDPQIAGRRALFEGTDLLSSYQGVLPRGKYVLKVSSGGELGAYGWKLSRNEFARVDSRLCGMYDLSDVKVSDPHYGCQWYLNDDTGFFGVAGDLNVAPVWEAGVTGAGINVALVDLGASLNHEDLLHSLVSARDSRLFDARGETAFAATAALVDDNLSLAAPGVVSLQGSGYGHGTGVAGIIAAAHNDVGLRGVAPDVTIYSFRRNLDLGWLDVGLEEMAVSNNSWAPGYYQFWPSNHGVPVDTLLEETEALVRRGVLEGFHGKGVSYVFGVGNNGRELNANLNRNITSNRTIAACAINALGKRASYSVIGANLWVCTPSGDAYLPTVVTTCASPEVGNNSVYCRFGVAGTSSSAAMVSGVVALLRSAYPHLTWRDVKLILAGSARVNDSQGLCSVDDPFTGDVDEAVSGWLDAGVEYGAVSGRYRFNHCYGFGVVDAKAAIDLAGVWSPVPEMLTTTATNDFAGATPSDATAEFTTQTVTMATDIDFVEFVEVDLEFDHDEARDLDIRLVSPSGNESQLVQPSEKIKNGSSGQLFRGVYRLGSARHLGEDPNGVWTLKIRDALAKTTGTFDDWTLKVYGHGPAPVVSGELEVDYAENATSAVATYSATTPNAADAVTWDLSGPDAALFTIDSATGALAFKAAPDFENPADSLGDNTYHVAVTASDGTHTGVRHVKINVTNIVDSNDHIISPREARVEYVENDTTIVQQFTMPQSLTGTPTWSLSGPDKAHFDISSDGAVRFKTPPDYEDATAKKKYRLKIAVKVGSRTDQTNLDVVVSNEDEPTAIRITPSEPRQGQALTVSASDPDYGFDVTTTQWNKRNSTEACTDGTGDWQPISGANTSTYTPTKDDVNCVLQATITYRDVFGTGKTISTQTQAVKPTAQNVETLTPPDNEQQPPPDNKQPPPPDNDRRPPPDKEQPPPPSNDRRPPLSDDQPPSTGFLGLGGNGGEPTNELPEFVSVPTELYVPENSPQGTKIGAPIKATDPENDDIRYALTGKHIQLFAINPQTGQITLTANAALDYESSPNSYTVTITATDPEGSNQSTETQTIINITDITLPNEVNIYDKNNNEAIDLPELLQALHDYQQNNLNEPALINIIKQYLNN